MRAVGREVERVQRNIEHESCTSLAASITSLASHIYVYCAFRSSGGGRSSFDALAMSGVPAGGRGCVSGGDGDVSDVLPVLRPLDIFLATGALGYLHLGDQVDMLMALLGVLSDDDWDMYAGQVGDWFLDWRTPIA